MLSQMAFKNGALLLITHADRYYKQQRACAKYHYKLKIINFMNKYSIYQEYQLISTASFKVSVDLNLNIGSSIKIFGIGIESKKSYQYSLSTSICNHTGVSCMIIYLIMSKN